MAKKKPEEEPITKMDIEILKSIINFLSRLPPESYLSVILTIAWSKTHEGPINQNDLLLGSLGGFTLPSALQGSTVANTWAIAYLGGLGFNFIDQDIAQWVEDHPAGDTLLDILSPAWALGSWWAESQNEEP